MLSRRNSASALSENVESGTLRQIVSTWFCFSRLTIPASKPCLSEVSASGGSHFALAVVVTEGNFLFNSRRVAIEDHSVTKSGSPAARPASNLSSDTKEWTKHRSGRSCVTTFSTTGHAFTCLQSTITGMFEPASASTASHRGIELKKGSCVLSWYSFGCPRYACPLSSTHTSRSILLFSRIACASNSRVTVQV